MPLPDGYILRHPMPDEASAVQDVLDASETADCGEPRRYETTVADEWRSSECDPAQDWWVAVAPDGRIAAVGWVRPDTPAAYTADHFVHPGDRGRGLGDVMLDANEARAVELARRTPGHADHRLVYWCEDSDEERLARLERRGFVPERQYFEMSIALDDGLDPPVWPRGIQGLRFRPGTDEEAVYQADQEAFADHHLFSPRSFDDWRLLHVDAAAGDVALWWLAWDGRDVAGFVIPFESDRGAVIADLAVRRPWRRRGIARALLLAAFASLRERGQTVARLYVDAQNVTHAVRVYEASGMHVSRRFEVLEKVLRP